MKFQEIKNNCICQKFLHIDILQDPRQRKENKQIIKFDKSLRGFVYGKLSSGE